ncbi:MAG: hypothetical protein Q9M12_02540 [Mariprofundus sp.]|nr:hypothetical protein [Mariprofundus sp.]
MERTMAPCESVSVPSQSNNISEGLLEIRLILVRKKSVLQAQARDCKFTPTMVNIE